MQQIQMVSHDYQRLCNFLKIIGICLIIFCQCQIHLVLNTDIIHHQSFVFSFHFSVYT